MGAGEWGLMLTMEQLALLVLYVVPMVLGVVQAAKRFGVTGKWSLALSLGVGFAVGCLVVAASLGVIPPWAQVVLTVIFGGVLLALAASGLYDLGQKWRSPRTTVELEVDTGPVLEAVAEVREAMDSVDLGESG